MNVLSYMFSALSKPLDARPEQPEAKALAEPQIATNSISKAKKEVVNPGPHNVWDVARLIAGEDFLASYPGSSQYSAGGISACGLAALNAARLVLGRCRGLIIGEELLLYAGSEETMSDILSICSYWTDTEHLELDQDVFGVPLFKNSLTQYDSVYDSPSLESIASLIQKLSAQEDCTAVIITRPPEILTCFKILTSSNDPIYVLFDSHPRQDHPNGSAMFFTSSENTIITRLHDLLQVDPSILSDRTLQWQAQLLAHFSGHFFVPAKKVLEHDEMTDLIVQTSMSILRLRAERDTTQSRQRTLREDNTRLELELEALRGKYERLKRTYSDSVSRHPAPSSPQDRTSNTVRAQQFPRHQDVQASQVFPKPTSKPQDKGKGRDVSLWAPEPSSSSSSTKSWAKVVGKKSTKLVQSARQPDASVTFNAPATSGNRFQQFEQPSLDDDFELARQLHEADELRYLQEQALLQSFQQQQFSCPICMEEWPEDSVARAEGCQHALCRGCMRDYIVAAIEEQKFPIVCPICKMDVKDGDKQTELDEQFCANMGITDRQLAILQEFQLAQFSILVHCRGCKKGAFVDRPEYEATKLIPCPLRGCTYVWCKDCSQAIDVAGPPHSCDGSSELEHLMKKKGWKHCPGCKTPVQKSSGCNHMNCMSPGCNTHFCYLCGALIVKSATRREIQRGVEAHYRSCTLFQH